MEAGPTINILAVDDNRENLISLQAVLERPGVSIVTAASGQEALKRLLDTDVAVILLDIQMPGMDGYETAQMIRLREKTRLSPIIFMTASLLTETDVSRGYAVGAVDYLFKPVDPDILKSKIAVFLELFSKTAALERQQEMLTRANQTLNGLYNFTESLNRCTSEIEVVKQALDRALELPGVEAGWIFQLDDRGGHRLLGAQGLPPALAAGGALNGDCECLRQLAAGERHPATHVHECERPTHAGGDTHGLRRHVSVPLCAGDKTLGVMNLAGSSEGLFAEGNLPEFQGIANQIGLALARAQLHAELERRIEARTAALHQSEERYRTLADAAEDHIFIVNRQFRVEYLNPAAVRPFGMPADQLIRKRGDELFPADAWEPLKANLESVFSTGESLTVEEHIPYPPPSGARWMNTRFVPLRNEIGEFTGVLGIARDVTGQKTLEEQFRQSQKMEAVGRLAGGIAHDFNNLLTVILGYGDLLLAALPEDDPRRSDVAEMVRAGHSAETLTRQLLAFSRKQLLEPKVLDLNAVLSGANGMLRRVIGEDVEIILRLDPQLALVMGDAGQIEQIIMNLAVNARDAMPVGGTLTIESANVELDEDYAQTYPGTTPGRYVMFGVSDTGHGMDVQTQARLFEPFFTTKEKDKGTGLGLATVYGIVKQSGGNIWVYSEPGQGTTFKIYLPRVEGVAQPLAKATPLVRLSGTETILIAEDVGGLRTLARRILERHGYTVLAAPNGEEALRICEGHEGSIHLLLTDVVMPGMNGPVLAERLTGLRPEMKVLYTSGYTDDAVVRHGILTTETAFMQKPYTAESLAQKVREVLDAAK